MGSEAVDGLASGDNYSVVRVNQELANRSSIGVLYVGRDGDGSLLGNGSDDQNHTYAVDGRLGSLLYTSDAADEDSRVVGTVVAGGG